MRGGEGKAGRPAGLGLRAPALGLRAPALGLRAPALGLRAPALGLRAPALGLTLLLALALGGGSLSAQTGLSSPLGSPPLVGPAAGATEAGRGADSGLGPKGGPSQIFEGRASWYGPGFAGKRTASGEIYDPEGLTAAHRSLPFGSLLRVTNLDTRASVVVRVNDRGPFVADRVLDLSEAAARLIGLLPTGTALVRCELLSPEEAAAFGAPPPAASLPSPAPAGSGSYRVQVASYALRANAEATLKRLGLSGIAAQLEGAGAFTRVVLPSVPSAELEALLARLSALGYRGPLVSPLP